MGSGVTVRVVCEELLAIVASEVVVVVVDVVVVVVVMVVVVIFAVDVKMVELLLGVVVVAGSFAMAVVSLTGK